LGIPAKGDNSFDLSDSLSSFFSLFFQINGPRVVAWKRVVFGEETSWNPSSSIPSEDRLTRSSEEQKEEKRRLDSFAQIAALAAPRLFIVRAALDNPTK
jgi:hypothetical protein